MSKYIRTYESLCPNDRISKTDPRRPAIIAEMRAIDKATTDAEAASAVSWWGVWPNERHATPEEFCREAKSLMAK
jgi:hypothetical protein